MNYIDEDTAFERWCENNYLPIFAQAIWKKLFKRFNRSGWCEWVTVDNLTLMADVQIKREATFIAYRDKLIGAGLIEYEKGKKGSPNKYKLTPISKCTFTGEVQSVVQSVVQSEVQSEVQSVVQTADITKHKQRHKQNLKEKDTNVSQKKNFLPPCLEDVRRYCDERKNSVDAQRFVDFYSSKGWYVGKNKMKDWKAAVRTWEHSDKGGSGDVRSNGNGNASGVQGGSKPEYGDVW